MSEEKKDGTKPTDMNDEYKNKLVESNNMKKLQLDEKDKEIAELKKQLGEKSEPETDKAEWKEEFQKRDKMIEELKQEMQVKKDETKVSKGIVTPLETQQTDAVLNQEEVKKLISDAIPTDKVKDVSNLSPIQRLGYFKAPTRAYSNQILGRALSLDAGRILSGQGEISRYAKKSSDDNVVWANKTTL